MRIKQVCDIDQLRAMLVDTGVNTIHVTFNANNNTETSKARPFQKYKLKEFGKNDLPIEIQLVQNILEKLRGKRLNNLLYKALLAASYMFETDEEAAAYLGITTGSYKYYLREGKSWETKPPLELKP